MAAILEYKALVAYGPDPILFKTSHPFDISKLPEHYNEAIWHPDAEVWHAAMQQEMNSLRSQGVFQIVSLPYSHKPISVHWVFAHKLDANRLVICGK